MKNRLTITISDINGSTTYSVDKIIKKFFLFIILIVLVVITGSFLWIDYLSNKISHLKKEKEKEIKILQYSKNKLLSENKLLNMQIKDKMKDIESLGDKLEEIEEIIGIDKNENSLSDIARADIVKLTLAQKKYMLQTIPSGSPLKKTFVTAKFGYRIHPITHKKQFHRGVDLRAKTGTKVYATADGVVRYAYKRNKGSFGRVVIISHNFGFESAYGHLKKVYVKIGDVVKKGEIIALSGNSGRSTGSHLHYEVRYASMVLNPNYFIKWDMKNYDDIFKVRRVKWDFLVKMINSQKKIMQIQ